MNKAKLMKGSKKFGVILVISVLAGLSIVQLTTMTDMSIINNENIVVDKMMIFTLAFGAIFVILVLTGEKTKLVYKSSGI
jgi:hypothetical protein